MHDLSPDTKIPYNSFPFFAGIRKVGILNMFFLLLSLKGQSQQLYVNLLNNTTETYLISNIRSITFNQNNMLVNENNGNTTSYSISSILNYSFINNVGISEMAPESDLLLFPNPASNEVQISLKGRFEGLIEIEIYDLTGRLMSKVYEGSCIADNTYRWRVNVSAGTYICTLRSGQKSISRPIVIR
jgi:hypothetical protein